MNKAQSKQVFVYMTAAVIFAFIMIFGYQAITGVLEKGEEVAFVRFQQNLQDSIREIHTDYRSVKIYDSENPLNVPGKYEQACFVNLNKNPPGDNTLEACANEADELNLIMCDVWQSTEDWEKGEQNVFLTPQAPSSISVYDIRIDADKDGEHDDDSNYYCFNTEKGRLDMRLEGRGDYTLISPLE